MALRLYRRRRPAIQHTKSLLFAGEPYQVSRGIILYFLIANNFDFVERRIADSAK